MKKASLAAAGMRLSLLTLASRVLGLAREMTKAAFLGTSGYADAFGIAFMLPNLFRRLFAENSISVAFIPTFKAYLEDADTPEGARAAREFAAAACTAVSFLSACVAVTGILAAPAIVPLFFAGASAAGDAEAAAEAVLLTRLMFPYLCVISVAAFFQGVLNALKIFAPSGFTPVLFNLAVIAATHLLSSFMTNPARAMSVGVLLGGAAQAAFQLPFVVRSGWKPALTGLRAAFGNAGLRRVLKLVGPTVVGMAAYQLNDVVSTALAGKAGVGVVSSLQYSLRLQELILGIFAVSIGTVILPDLSGLAKRGRWGEFNAMLASAVKLLALVTLPATVFSLVAGDRLIVLLYKTRRFTDESVRLTHEAFRFHVAGLFFIAANRVLSPAFYARGDTASPTLAGLVGVAANVTLACALARPLSGGGIALALSLASAANTAALAFFLGRRGCGTARALLPAAGYAAKVTLCSLAAGGALLLAKPFLFAPFEGFPRAVAEGVPLALSVALFAGIAGGALLLVKDTFLRSLLARLRRSEKTDDRVS
jgi:putative peptidoglycan lipid II flippase